MTRSLQDIENQLNDQIDPSSIKEREGGGGKTLSYLEGHTVIGRLNRVFGPLGWASQTSKLDLVFSGEVDNRYGKKSHCVSYIAQVRLVVQGPDGKATEHTCTGYGDGMDANNPGKAHELAVKEAETDALKRCAKNLGNSMGLELYDKAKNAAREVKEEKEVKVEQRHRDKAREHQELKKILDPVNEEQLKVLNLISKTSTVAIARQKTTLDALKSEMRKRYSVDNKDLLTFDQAKEFLNYLNETNGG